MKRIFRLRGITFGIAVFAAVIVCSLSSCDITWDDNGGYDDKKTIISNNILYENGYFLSIRLTNVDEDGDYSIVPIGSGDEKVDLLVPRALKSVMNDDVVLNAVTKALAHDKTANTIDRLSGSFEDIRCTIEEIEGPYEESAEELAEKFYAEKRLGRFSVMTNHISDKTLADFLDRSYEDKRLSFFSILLDQTINPDYDAFAEKAYDDDRISFFSLVIEHTSDETREELLNRAVEDENISFFSILFNYD